MVDYLKQVKTNSIIMMAIKDSTYYYHWSKDWIDYVDSYGSKTVIYPNEGWVRDEGCPFVAGNSFIQRLS